jgi:exoribonuclease R
MVRGPIFRPPAELSSLKFFYDFKVCLCTQAKAVHETNSMVEEFMLAANISSAERIYKDFPDCAM